MPRLLRLTEVRRVYPKGRSSVYDDIKKGLLTPPVAIGERCSAWPEDELDAVIRARIAGATKDDLRRLVAQLVAARKAV